jgi:hypothetical protein
MSSVRIEAACDDVFMFSFPACTFLETRVSGGKNKNPPEIPAGFKKTVLPLTRSEIPPEQNDMPRNALQRGGHHRLGRFHEHSAGYCAKRRDGSMNYAGNVLIWSAATCHRFPTP